MYIAPRNVSLKVFHQFYALAFIPHEAQDPWISLTLGYLHWQQHHFLECAGVTMLIVCAIKRLTWLECELASSAV